MANFEVIKKKIALLKKYDINLAAFGSSEHKYELNPVLTEEDITDFEKRERIILPKSYRDFLKYIGNGGAGPAYGLYALEDARNGAGWYPPIENLNNKSEDNDAPGELLIVHNGCGLFTWLKVVGPSGGEIWYDGRTNDGENYCLSKDFLEWYEDWADSIFFEKGFITHLGNEALQLGLKKSYKEAIELFKLATYINFRKNYHVRPEVKTEYLKIFCNVLYFLQNDNTGLSIDKETNHFFLEKCLVYAKENPAIYFNAACVYNEMKDFKNVVECIEQAKQCYDDYNTMIETIKKEGVFAEFRKDPLFVTGNF